MDESRIDFGGGSDHTKRNRKCLIFAFFQPATANVDLELTAVQLGDRDQHRTMDKQWLKLRERPG